MIEFFYLNSGNPVPDWMVVDLFVDHLGDVYEEENGSFSLRSKEIGWRAIDT